MPVIAQQFKQELMNALNKYIAQFNTKKTMTLQRSQDVAYFIAQLETHENNTLELYKAVQKKHQTMKVSWIEDVFKLDLSALRKGIGVVLKQFPYSELLDEQVQELIKTGGTYALIDRENENYRNMVSDLKDRLEKAENYAKELEIENAGLKIKLQELEKVVAKSSAVLTESKPEIVIIEGLQIDLSKAHKKIQELERSVCCVQEDNDKLKKNNTLLGEKNLQLIKEKNEAKHEVDELVAAKKSEQVSTSTFWVKPSH